MSEESSKGLGLESWLLVVLVVSLLLSGTFIALVSLNKEPVFSPYLTDADTTINAQQIGDSRTTFGEGGMGYSIANTMSTPMLVNDWKDPHRTLLVIVAPEKPFDAAEASAIHDFVTKKGGKVILASNSTNAQPVAELFGVKYFGDPVVDPYRYYEVENAATGAAENPDAQRLWAVAGVTRNATDMGEAAKVACSEEQVSSRDVENCRLPVLFHRPTAITVLEDQPETNRRVNVLAAASTPAFIASVDFNPDNIGNPILGEGKTGLIVRMDYPVEGVLEQRSPEFGGGQGEINVTGSIVFVSDHLSSPTTSGRRMRQSLLVASANCSAPAPSTKAVNRRPAGDGQPGPRRGRHHLARQRAVLRGPCRLHDGTRQRGDGHRHHP